MINNDENEETTRQEQLDRLKVLEEEIAKAKAEVQMLLALLPEDNDEGED
jgi:hypothetical protein